MRNGMWWVPAPIRRMAGIATVVMGAFIGTWVTLGIVGGVDHFANNGALYGALMVDAQAANDVCIFMCRNGGQMTLNFGRIIGNMDVDLRELADFLNGMAKIVHAAFTTSNSSLGTARIIVMVGALCGGVLGPLASRR